MTEGNKRIGSFLRWLSSWCSRAFSPPKAIKTLPTDCPHRFATFLIVVVSIVIVFCIGWGACALERRLIASAGHNLVQAATDSASKLEMMIAERHADIQVLSSSPIVRGRDRVALTSYLYRLLKSYHAYQWIGVTDADGVLIASTDPGTVSPNRRTSPWFQQTAKTNDVTILDARMNQEGTKTLAITISEPVRTLDGRFHGVVAATVEVPYLVDLLDRTTQVLQSAAWSGDPHIEYQLLNGNGDLIADSNLRQEGRLNLRDLGLLSAQLVANSERGFVEEEHLRRHKPVITAYAQVNLQQARPPLRWGILIRADRDSILTPIRTFLRNLMLVATLIVVPIALLLIWLVKQLHREWHLATQESLRASEAESALKTRAEALHALVKTANSLAAAPDIESQLRHVLKVARATTGARYAALGVLDSEKKRLARCLTIGLDEARVCAIGALPVKGGILSFLAQREGVFRIDDLSTQVMVLDGLPPYLPLTSFLGISLRCHGELFGQLYLVEKVSHEGTVTVFTDLDEQVLLMLAAQAAISIENLQLLHDSKQQALRDSLTGLLNHSAILDALGREMDRAERQQEPAAVLMADLDHFKRINDTYGHRVGDLVLREVARRIRETARRYDLVGRVGGEEFLIILPGCDQESTSEIAERIRSAIGDVPIDAQGGSLSVTVSIGAATWLPGQPSHSHLLWETADQALYSVKHNGRNGVVVNSLPRNEGPKRYTPQFV